MDEDKNSSNLPLVNNAGSVSAPLSPDVPNAAGRVIASTPEVVAPVVPAEPGTGQAHPFFAHHPTQTFNTEVGDIILNTGAPKPKQNKRPFIIGGIILAAAVIISIVILAITSMDNSSIDVTQLINSHLANLSDLEMQFSKAAHDQTTLSEALDENFAQTLNQDFDNAKQLQVQLAGLNAKKTAAAVVQLSKQLDAQISFYQNTVDLYNQVRDALMNSDISYFTELSNSENQNLADVGDYLSEYLTEKQYWQSRLDANNCNQNTSAECTSAQSNYEALITSMDASCGIVRMIFTAYEGNDAPITYQLHQDAEQIIQEGQDA